MGEVKVLIKNFSFHHVLGEVKTGTDPELFVSSLYISAAIKASLLKCSMPMFNIRNNKTCLYFFFSSFKIVDLM